MGVVVQGVGSAYVCFFPDLAVPGAAATVGAFAELAVAHGVGRLVLLSGRGEEEAQRAERAVQGAGADWTIVRCAWFSQNFSESFLLEPVLAGEVALPVDGVPEPFVDVEDGHAGQIYELTGPRALTFAEAVAEIGRGAGRPVRFAPVSVERFAATMVGQGVPDDVAGLMIYLFTEVLDGRNAQPADGVRRAIGRAPRDFRDYACATAATGAWAA